MLTGTVENGGTEKDREQHAGTRNKATQCRMARRGHSGVTFEQRLRGGKEESSEEH